MVLVVLVIAIVVVVVIVRHYEAVGPLMYHVSESLDIVLHDILLVLRVVLCVTLACGRGCASRGGFDPIIDPIFNGKDFGQDGRQVAIL